MTCYNELMKNCPILFSQRNLTEQESCMSFGIECGDGWYEPLSKLCFKLEDINRDYRRYGIEIQAQQIKEKLGGLRFYYGVYFIEPFFIRLIKFLFFLCELSLSKFDFKVTLNKENKGGKSCVVAVATKHLFFYKIKNFCHKVCNTKYFETNKTRINKANLVSEIADNLIREAEEDCWNTCERCGERNNREKTNIVSTSGWISRLCKKCAQKSFDKRTYDFDKSHPNDKFNGIDRITLFNEGYWFLNFFNGDKDFEYNGENYYSIAHAFFVSKNPEWESFYRSMVIDSKGKFSYLIYELSQKLDIEPEESDYEMLKELVRARFNDKFAKELKQDLIRTGNKMLINMNKHCENILGVCCCDRCKSEKGLNLYGKALMEIREELMKNI